MITIAQLKDLLVSSVCRVLGKVYSPEFVGKLTGNADTATSATKATQDESGNNIKASYASSISISDHTITLKNKNGASLGTVTVPDNNTTYSTATTSANGLMSSSDKSKLDGITASADAVSFTRNLTSGTKVGTITINGTGTDLYAPTNTDTHYTTGLKVGASATATANAAATNGNVHINALDNTTVRDSHKIVGSGATTVTSDANGVITISSTDTNTIYTHPTTSGNKHIPSGGSSGQILRWSADGTAAWGADSDTHYTSHLYVGAPGGNANATSATSNPCLLCVDNTTNRNSIQLKAGSNMSISAVNGIVTFSSTDTNTTYSAGTGISLSGTTFSNAGVRSISTGSTNGTISVNTNGTSAEVAVKGLGSAAYTASSNYATASHTHKYAGSSSAGGSATSAVKLDSSAGSSTTPIYFSSGKPVACTYSFSVVTALPSSPDPNTFYFVKA